MKREYKTSTPFRLLKNRKIPLDNVTKIFSIKICICYKITFNDFTNKYFVLKKSF